jgi:hypothetical protein
LVGRGLITGSSVARARGRAAVNATGVARRSVAGGSSCRGRFWPAYANAAGGGGGGGGGASI